MSARWQNACHLLKPTHTFKAMIWRSKWWKRLCLQGKGQESESYQSVDETTMYDKFSNKDRWVHVSQLGAREQREELSWIVVVTR